MHCWRTPRNGRIGARVQSLLASRGDVNQTQVDGMTALHWAAYHDDLEMAKLLVEAKAKCRPRTAMGSPAGSGVHQWVGADRGIVARRRRRSECNAYAATKPP